MRCQKRNAEFFLKKPPPLLPTEENPPLGFIFLFLTQKNKTTLKKAGIPPVPVHPSFHSSLSFSFVSIWLHKQMSPMCGGATSVVLFTLLLQCCDAFVMEYIGCYGDHTIRDLPDAENRVRITPEVCQVFCTINAPGAPYLFMGLQHEDECRCGNSYGMYGPAPETECNTPCIADPSQMCGGGGRNSVYRIIAATPSPPTPAPPTPAPTLPRVVIDRGCWKDIVDPRQLDGAHDSQNYRSVTKCIEYCRVTAPGAPYRYLGMENYGECWCGNDYGRHGMAVGCTNPCDDDPSQICGGPWMASVYEVIDGTAVPTASPPTPAPTPAPTTPAPPTPAPPTDPPITPSPPTPAPPTTSPPTPAPPTISPPTPAPPTAVPLTNAPKTPFPATPAPPTAEPTAEPTASPTDSPPTQTPGVVVALTAQPSSEVPEEVTITEVADLPLFLKEDLVDQEAVSQGATVALIGGSVAGGLAAGAAMQLAVVASGCGPGFPAILHPTGVVIDNSEYVGAGTMNLTICIGFAAVCFAILKLASLCGRAVFPRFFDGLDTQGFLRMPSVPLVIFQFLYQGMTLAGMLLFLGGEKKWHYAAGAAVLLFCVVVPFAVARWVQKSIGRDVVFVTEEYAYEKGMLYQFMLGRGEWINAHRGLLWVERWSSVIRPFDANTQWFILVEFAASFALSAAKATQPKSSVGCGHVKITSAVIFLALLVMELTVRPHVKVRDGVTYVFVRILEFVSMILLALGYYRDDGDSWEFSLGSSLLFAAVFLLVVKVVLDVVCLVMQMLTSRRKRLQENYWAACDSLKRKRIAELDIFTSVSRTDLLATPLLETHTEDLLGCAAMRSSPLLLSQLDDEECNSTPKPLPQSLGETDPLRLLMLLEDTIVLPQNTKTASGQRHSITASVASEMHNILT